MISFLYLFLGYTGLITWAILLFLLIAWRIKGHELFASGRESPEILAKRLVKLRKIIWWGKCLLYLARFSIIIDSVDILLMTVGLLAPHRLIFKGIILAASCAFYFMLLLAVFIGRRILAEMEERAQAASPTAG